MKNSYMVRWEEYGTDRYDNWDWRSRDRIFDDAKSAKRFLARLERDDQKLVRRAEFQLLK